MIGVNFQPGTDPNGQADSRRASTPVQEAIKVLSLRLPRVVGANAISPQALLSSPGSGGNPRVDSVVNTILQRMFPSGFEKPPAGQAPMIPPTLGPGPNESRPMPSQPPATIAPFPIRRERPSVDYAPPPSRTPHITFDRPFTPEMPAPVAPPPIPDWLRGFPGGNFEDGGGSPMV